MLCSRQPGKQAAGPLVTCSSQSDKIRQAGHPTSGGKANSLLEQRCFLSLAPSYFWDIIETISGTMQHLQPLAGHGLKRRPAAHRVLAASFECWDLSQLTYFCYAKRQVTAWFSEEASML